MIGKVDKKWFIGIPSPTAAALMVGMIWLDNNYNGLFNSAGSVFALLMTLFAGLSMVVQIPFWSFKETNPRLKIPFLGMIGIVLFLMVFVLEPALVLFSFFLLYSLSGYVMWLLKKWVKSN